MRPSQNLPPQAVIALVIALAGIVILGSFPVSSPSQSQAGFEGELRASAGGGGVSATLTGAIASLRGGSGPAAREGLSCQLIGSEAARCGSVANGGPLTSLPILGFQNSTAGRTAPPGTDLANLAWDVTDNEVVFFGGWDGHQVTNQTWVFRDGSWHNATQPGLGQAPPARYGAAMAYDNQTGVDSVVLFGGCNFPGDVCPMNDTWLFSVGSWQNLTRQIGPAPKLSNATMTSWGQNGTILFGGCSSSPCGSESNATWAFQNTSECQALYAHPCWDLLAVHGESPPGLAGAALIDDLVLGPTNGTILLYGGYNSSCPTCVVRNSNATWIYSGASWLNVTATYAGSPYPNAAPSFASLFWDPISAEFYLYAGFNTSAEGTYDQLWALPADLETWINESNLMPLPSPTRIWSAVTGGVSETGMPLPAMLFGGGGPTLTNATENETWVFEPSVVNSFHVAPNPVEANATVYFFSNSSGGTQPTANWSTGVSGPAVDPGGTYAYPAPGTYSAVLTATDIYGVQNVSRVPVVVHLFSVSLEAPSFADEPGSVAFSSTAANGTAPYTYTWVFPNSTVAYGASVSHVFSATGLGSVNLSVRDAVGTVVHERAEVQINPPLTASAGANLTVLDVDATTLLSTTGSGGTPPYTSVWTFPGNRTLTGASVPFRPTAVGTVTLTSVLTDQAEVSRANTLTLTVNPALSFNVSSSSSSPTSGRSVSFTTKITGGTSPYTFFWMFGDGSSSSAPAPSYTYPRAGTFTVNVWVNDSGGGSFRQTVEVKIPRTSGGLLWEIIGLPTIDQIVIAVVLAAVVVAIASLAYRRHARTQRAKPPRATPTRPKA